MNDKDTFRMMRENFYTGLLCDVMDTLGYRNQAMDIRVRPLQEDAVAVGRAKTILTVDVYEISDDRYSGEIAAMDSIREDEVVVVCTNNSPNNGVWGELMTTAASMRGAVGAIVDGLCRDTKKIRAMGFPLFASGYKPLDSAGRGKVIDFDCPVECGGVRVEPGDVVFADFDGVAVIPKAIFPQVLELAQAKLKKENQARDALLSGKLLREVYDDIGVL